jgi:anti-sigma regulatory factor (Ser/Thr protein kinase)
MTFNQEAPSRTGIDYAIRHPLDSSAPFDHACKGPRMIRLPADCWDSPSAVGCALNGDLKSARVARRLTRNTLRAWGLITLVADAETIVGELVANAVTHAAAQEGDRNSTPGAVGLRLLRRTGEVICAVLDASSALPVLKPSAGADEAGRGLQMVDALSDVWGWSPVAGRGKVVWAILFCPERPLRPR